MIELTQPAVCLVDRRARFVNTRQGGYELTGGLRCLYKRLVSDFERLLENGPGFSQLNGSQLLRQSREMFVKISHCPLGKDRVAENNSSFLFDLGEAIGVLSKPLLGLPAAAFRSCELLLDLASCHVPARTRVERGVCLRISRHRLG